MNSKIKVDINKCARCQEYHKQLEFSVFSQNPIIDCDDVTWNYWAICPQTQEPILLRVITVEEGSLKDS